MYSERNERVSVIIAAAGKGTRMGLDQNKQYIDILGKPLLARTIQVFADCTVIDEIVVVANEEEVGYCRENITDRYGFGKVRCIVSGGSTRQQSVFNGLMSVSPDCGIVLIHDGARPFIDEDSIMACISAAAQSGAAIAAVPVKDTIKRGGADGFVDETVDRSSLWSIQTPQAFRYPLIVQAHRRAVEEGFDGTDDAVLVERQDMKVQLVQSSYYNIKITTREDLAIAVAIAGLGR